MNYIRKVLIHCESDSNVRLMCQDDPRCAGIESPHATLLWCQQAKETLKASVLQDIWIYLDWYPMQLDFFVSIHIFMFFSYSSNPRRPL